MANVAFNVIIIMVICVRRRKFYTPEANTLYDRSVSDNGHPHARTPIVVSAKLMKNGTFLTTLDLFVFCELLSLFLAFLKGSLLLFCSLSLSFCCVDNKSKARVPPDTCNELLGALHT